MGHFDYKDILGKHYGTGGHSDSDRNRNKDRKSKRKDTGDQDIDWSGFNTDDNYGLDFGPVKGLSNQIRHVGMLRKLPPYNSVKA